MLNSKNCFGCRKVLVILCLLALDPTVYSFPTMEEEPTRGTFCPLEQEITPCSCRKLVDDGLEFTCHNTNLKRLLDIFSVFRKVNNPIKSMTILDSNIEIIPEDAFAGLIIEKLVILNCNIRNIAKSAFTPLKDSLSELVLARNSLKEVPTYALNELENLRLLDLSHNILEGLRESAFQGLHHLEELRLHNNIISAVHPFAFEECCQYLLALNMASNQLFSVPSDALSSLVNISYLKLSDNNIMNIQKEAFYGLTTLNTLDLSNNFIANIDNNAFQSSSMHSLILKNNNMRSLLENAFVGLESTTEWLDMSYNDFVTVPTDALSKLRSLSHLDLSHNNIKELDDATFDQFGNYLRYLVLNDNHIQKVSEKAFQNLSRLEFLMLGKNNITMLTREAVETILENIFVLDVSENPLQCNCDLAWLKDWYASVDLLDRMAPEATCIVPEEGLTISIEQLICGPEEAGSTPSGFEERSCSDLECLKTIVNFIAKRTWWYY